jgi:hypothetical protein
LVLTTSRKETLRLSVEKAASEMLMEVAEQLDLWCQEMGNPAYKPLKGRILKRRSRQDITAKRKSVSGPQPGLGAAAGSVSRATGGTLGNSALKHSSESDEEELLTLPESLEAMKTGFLQFRRMQLKGQLVGSGDEKVRHLLIFETCLRLHYAVVVAACVRACLILFP